MRILWTRAAADDLEQIGRYLLEHQPALAQSTIQKLYQAAESLTEFPNRGRASQLPSTRAGRLAAAVRDRLPGGRRERVNRPNRSWRAGLAVGIRAQRP